MTRLQFHIVLAMELSTFARAHTHNDGETWNNSI